MSDCTSCGRSVEDCDDDPDTSADQWDHKRETHYTVDSVCPGYAERHDDPGDSDLPYPDFDRDEAREWGGID